MLNRTQRQGDAATVLARKAGYLLTVLLLFIAGFVLVGLKPSQNTVIIANQSLFIEKATTSQEKAKGLSGRESIAENAGMLFTFEQNERACIWMKDMKFSIDVIWLDADSRIVKVVEHMSPASYPTSYCPNEYTPYVLELPDGTVSQLGVSTGTFVGLE